MAMALRRGKGSGRQDRKESLRGLVRMRPSLFLLAKKHNINSLLRLPLVYRAYLGLYTVDFDLDDETKIGALVWRRLVEKLLLL